MLMILAASYGSAIVRKQKCDGSAVGGMLRVDGRGLNLR